MTKNRFESRAACAQADIADELCEAIKQVCYHYSDRIPLALALGCIEVAKVDLMESARE